MANAYTQLLAIAARTALRCERLLLRMSREKLDENDVLTHNDECIRLQGIVDEMQGAPRGAENREPYPECMKGQNGGPDEL